MSAQAKHTPGPWRVVGREVMPEDGSVYPSHVVDSGGREVCPLEAPCIAQFAVDQPGSFWDTTETKRANAALIAAAPDMLAALRDLRQRFHAACIAHGSDAWAADAACSKADAAIAKAEGRS